MCAGLTVSQHCCLVCTQHHGSPRPVVQLTCAACVAPRACACLPTNRCSTCRPRNWAVTAQHDVSELPGQHLGIGIDRGNLGLAGCP